MLDSFIFVARDFMATLTFMATMVAWNGTEFLDQTQTHLALITKTHSHCHTCRTKTYVIRAEQVFSYEIRMLNLTKRMANWIWKKTSKHGSSDDRQTIRFFTFFWGFQSACISSNADPKSNMYEVYFFLKSDRIETGCFATFLFSLDLACASSNSASDSRMKKLVQLWSHMFLCGMCGNVSAF